MSTPKRKRHGERSRDKIIKDARAAGTIGLLVLEAHGAFRLELEMLGTALADRRAAAQAAVAADPAAEALWAEALLPEKCAGLAAIMCEVHARLIARVYGPRSLVVERAIADALWHGGDWDVFGAAVSARLAATAEPIVRVEYVAGDGQVAVALDQRPASQPRGWDDRVRITIDMPARGCSGTALDHAWQAALRSGAVAEVVHDDGITSTYLDDLDLYARYYAWTWGDGRSINAFVRAIQAGDVRVPQWSGDETHMASAEAIKRALTRARRRFDDA